MIQNKLVTKNQLEFLRITIHMRESWLKVYLKEHFPYYYEHYYQEPKKHYREHIEDLYQEYEEFLDGFQCAIGTLNDLLYITDLFIEDRAYDDE